MAAAPYDDAYTWDAKKAVDALIARAEAAEARCARLQQALADLYDPCSRLADPSHQMTQLEWNGVMSRLRYVVGEIERNVPEALAGPDTPADSHYRERPIEEDFYLDPRGEWVYRWSDERRVLKPADSQEDKT